MNAIMEQIKAERERRQTSEQQGRDLRERQYWRLLCSGSLKEKDISSAINLAHQLERDVDEDVAKVAELRELVDLSARTDELQAAAKLAADECEAFCGVNARLARQQAERDKTAELNNARSAAEQMFRRARDAARQLTLLKDTLPVLAEVLNDDRNSD